MLPKCCSFTTDYGPNQCLKHLSTDLAPCSPDQRLPKHSNAATLWIPTNLLFKKTHCNTTYYSGLVAFILSLQLILKHFGNLFLRSLCIYNFKILGQRWGEIVICSALTISLTLLRTPFNQHLTPPQRGHYNP